MCEADAYLASLDETPVAPQVESNALRARLGRPLGDCGVPAAEVIHQLAEDCRPGLMGSAGGRFFGWVIGSALPAAVAADWLTSIWDQNAALYASSPAAAVVEEIAGNWLKEVLRLPRHCSFAFTTGCQMAHVTALAAARGGLLRRLGWDVAEQGLACAPAIRLLASPQGHGSITRAATLLGFGREAIARLKTDRLGRIEPIALSDALAQRVAPTIVVLQAGDIVSGAFDDFTALIPIAHAAGAWVHVDGAFGLWARTSEIYRHLTTACERADSWATDGHKVLNTPFDSGYAIVAHPDEHRAAFRLTAPYLTHASDARDPIDWNPEWSRRARGFATYAALRSLGRQGIADLFDNLCAHTRSLTAALAAIPGVEVVSPPIVNQALVRFLDLAPEANEEAHDRRTDAVIAAINASGEAFFTGTSWNGQRVMRISVVSWRTGAQDVARAVAAARHAVLSSLLSGAEDSTA
jgi:glutamate/tyrosine decarboxylase-like PLP-dependent enzyme